GSFVIQVAATDPDTEEFSKNIYSIDGPDSEFFEIDRISGNLTLKKTLDREKKSVHKFKVYAQDGFWKVSASMTIIVEDSNDNSPKFLEDVYNFTILKKNVLAERKIGKITATDEDEGKNKEILYFLVPNITFIQIDPKSGRLSFSTTRDIADIVDTTDPISFEVGAMDLGSPSNVAITKVNIFIIDETHFENCEFVKESYNFFVNKFEKLSLGVIETQGYCIFDLEGNSSTVRIDRSTGEITGDFSGYKSGEELSFKIRARSISNSSNFVETEAKIIFKEKIDLVWKLEFYNFTVKENSELNTTIGTVSVNSSSATYEIFSNYSIPFGVDKDSGRIFVKNFIDSDFEPRFEFCQFEIHATVPGYFMKKLETVVNIRILDENDNLPEFGFLERTIFVSGPIPVGSVVFVSEASDSDSELFNEVFYSISKNNNFEIDTKSGEVFSLTNLDFSMSESYEFAVKASNFNSSKSSFCKIRIELRVPVPNTAIFVKKYDFIEISKRSKISTILTQLEAQSMFGIQYFFIEPLHEKFLMERNGILRLTKKLSLNESFVLTSIVKSGLLKRRAPTVCSIRISTNDLAPAPIFPEEKYFLSLPEDALDKEVLKFNFVLPSDSRMEVHGKDKEKLQGSIPDMLIHITGVENIEKHKFKLFLSVLSPGGEILPAPETLRILDNFVSKKQKFLDVTDYRGYVSLCDLKDCGSDICQNVRILKNTWETFRSAEKLWHVPRVQMFGNCKAAQVQKSPSTKLLNEEDCGKSKCFHGRCIGNNTCLCDSNYFGETCSSRIYSFGQNSFLNLPLKKQLSKLSFLIITKESHGLLFYSRSSTSNSSIMIDYINGKPRISTTGLRGSFSSLLQESINDGHWHKVSLKAQPTGTFTFVVENCDDTCLVCQSINCHTVVPSVFIDEEVTIGGLSEKEITEFQPSATFLRACVKNISVDEEETSEFENFEELKKVETYEESRNFGEFKESGILDICPILFPNNYCESSEAQTSCGKGTCESEWDDYKCICPDGIESVSCNSDDQTISLKNGRIRLKLSPFAQNRLKSVHHDSRVFKREDRMFYDNSYHRDVRKSSEENSNSRSSQFLEIDVRTSESEAHIFSMKFGSQRSSLRVVNGSLHYGIYNKENLVDEVIGKSADEDIQNKEKLLDEVVVGKPINDGVWHRIRIEVDSGGTVVRLKMDDHSKEMNSFVHFPKFVFKELESMEFGSFGKESFFGCLRRLVINGQMQLLYPKSRTLLEQFFQTEITSQISSIQLGCENTFICENSISENPKISKCNFASLNPKTRFILVSGLCVIFVSFTVLLVLGLFHYYKTKKRRRLARNTQRISNLQLVSTIEGRSTYKNWSYDELDNTETNRHRCTNGHENSAYLSHNSLETTHIYDEATAENYGRRVSGNYDEAVIENYDRVASGNYDKTFTGNTGAFRPVKQFQKPMVMPRKKPPSPENQPTSSVPNNPYRSRFFRPGETFGLFSNISGNHNYPISLDDFHHEPVEEETGQMSQKV
ncbi:hypothetical protein FO519_003856, partial [Halicephalobus sp. NKZ332]